MSSKINSLAGNQFKDYQIDITYKGEDVATDYIEGIRNEVELNNFIHHSLTNITPRRYYGKIRKYRFMVYDLRDIEDKEEYVGEDALHIGYYYKAKYNFKSHIKFMKIYNVYMNKVYK